MRNEHGKELVFFTFSNSYSTQFWLQGITLLLVYFWTLSNLSDPIDSATVSHCERKTNHSLIYWDIQLTCIVQSLTVTLSYISKLVYYASLLFQSLITTLWPFLLAVCLYPGMWVKWRSFCRCLEEPNMTAEVSPTFLRSSACVLTSAQHFISWGPFIMKALGTCDA